MQGGGATETDNAIKIQATTSEGAPLPAARVVLVRTDTWLRDVSSRGTPTTLSYKTDLEGRLRIESLPPGEWTAQVETLSQACDIPLGRDTATRILKLQDLSTVDVALDGLSGARLLAVGTSWGASTDSLDRATLRLPAGRRMLVASRDSVLTPALSVTLAAGGQVDTSVTVDVNRLLLDDFSAGDGRATISNFTGMGRWFVNAWGTQVYSDADPRGASLVGALSLRYIAPDTGDAVLAGIAFHDGEAFRPMDFSRMDSLCFDIRANGEVKLFFIEYGSDNNWNLSADAEVGGISTVWSRRCVKADSLRDSWPTVRTSANTIAFLARRGDLLEIRNLVLWGVPLASLSR